MEHVIQLSFSLDDDRIQQQMEAAAVKDVIKRFDEAVLRAARMQRGRWSNYESFDEAAIDFLQKSIDQFVEDHRDVIIDAAGKALADRLCRTKRAREILEDVTI